MNFEVLSARLLRLARLDTSVFDEVRMDPTATTASFLVVVASSFAAGLGGWLWWLLQDFNFDDGRVFVQSFILGSLLASGLWVVWLFVTYVLLTQVFRERADLQQLIRTMGMAAVPLALTVLMVIWPIGFAVGLAAVALLFGLHNVAIQTATTADTARVLVANAAGFAVWAIILSLLVDVSDRTYLAPGIFLSNFS